MILAAYILYVAQIAFTALRLHHRAAGGLMSTTVVVAPVLSALILFVMIRGPFQESVAVFLGTIFGLSTIGLVLGLLTKNSSASGPALVLKVAGWSVLAGIFLIPSSLSLLLPVIALAGLATFLPASSLRPR